jgi:hypothetical protein
MNITRNLIVAVLMTIVTTLMLGVIYPLRSRPSRRSRSRIRPMASWSSAMGR